MDGIPFLMVHVGQSITSQRNLQYGIDTRSWGFPLWKHELRDRPAPRFAILGTGVAPRIPAPQWHAQEITLYLFEIRGGFYDGVAPHWPDEEADNQVKYPARFGIEPLARMENVPLDPEGPLGAAGTEALRLSGIDRGMGKIAVLDSSALFRLAEITADEWHQVALSEAPGFTAADVTGAKVPRRGRRGTGRISDPKKRRSIELHAVEEAEQHYRAQGWTVERIGAPYDLRCTRGRDELHVEVKGTTGALTSVELTINEVNHAHAFTTDLYVVSDIVVHTQETTEDRYPTSGGRTHHIPDWRPAPEDLRPMRYEYRVPQANR